MVEAARGQRHTVPLHLSQNPLTQAHHVGLEFRHDKRHALMHAALDQFRDPPVSQRLDLPEKLLRSLTLRAGKDV
jgi:hypothetical protein